MDQTGQHVGLYRLTQLLGRGPFAQVYLGHSPHKEQPVVLKIFQARLPPAEQERWLAEVGQMSRLVHPNILPLLDAGVERDTPFLVMDYAPGGPLRPPQGETFSPALLVPQVKQIAAALEYADKAGVAHGNLRPENLLLGAQQEVQVSDWSLDVLTEHVRSTNREERPVEILYVAPEGLRGQAQPLSDQYALGVMVYEWLSGRAPFQGTYFSIAEQHLYAPPAPLRGRVSDLSPAVEGVVLRALAKNPLRRFASSAEFATALEEATRDPASNPARKYHFPAEADEEEDLPASLDGPTFGTILRRFSWRYKQR